VSHPVLSLQEGVRRARINSVEGNFPKVFPVQLVWFNSFIQLFGGGLYTAAALMWAMASEAFPEDER